MRCLWVFLGSKWEGLAFNDVRICSLPLSESTDRWRWKCRLNRIGCSDGTFSTLPTLLLWEAKMDLLADTKKPMPLFWPICCCMETQRIFVFQSSFYQTLFLFPLGSPGLNWALIKSRAWFTLRPASQKRVSQNGVPERALITFQEAIIQTRHKASFRRFKTIFTLKCKTDSSAPANPSFRICHR